MASKSQVIALYNSEPELTVRQAALRLKCLPAYITATSKRNGFRFARANYRRHTATELRARAAILILRAELLEPTPTQGDDT